MVGSQAQFSRFVMEQVRADAEKAKVFDEVTALKDVPHPGAGFGQSRKMDEPERCVHECGDDDDETTQSDRRLPQVQTQEDETAPEHEPHPAHD